MASFDDDSNRNNKSNRNSEPIGTRQHTVNTGTRATRPPSNPPAEEHASGTMTEDELLAMGIDINEIRAQREIERRLEEEAKQQEYAEQLQAEFNREYSAGRPPVEAESSTAPSTLPTTDNTRERAASVSPIENQLERLAVASSSSNVITIEDDDTNTNTAATTTSTRKRLTNVRTGPPPPKRRRRRHYWLLPGESVPDTDSSEDELLDWIGETLASSSRNNNNTQVPKTRNKVSTDDIGLLADSVPSNKALAIPRNALNGLDVTLMKHQKEGFRWMYKQETSENKGGLLCDDMGLGKTIQSLAIMVARPCLDPGRMPANIYLTIPKQTLLVKATLIVCPANLMAQWKKEIESKTKDLSVLVHHGSNRSSNGFTFGQYDAVITSYTTLASEYSSLGIHRSRKNGIFRVVFHRVILDEAHTIKNHKTSQSSACYYLQAIHRWCLTASPIQNRPDDMYSLIRFLDISPYNDQQTFKSQIAMPMASSDSSEKDAARKLFQTFALRRTKQLMTGDQPIIKLPDRKVHVTYVDFTQEERNVYESVNNGVLSELNYRGSGGFFLRKNMTLMALLLRLRQACLHPALSAYQPGQYASVQTVENIEIKVAKSLGKSVVNRLLSMKNELPFTECSICMDIADQPRIIHGCGHILCAVCLNNYINSDSCYYNGNQSCPECRGALESEKVIPVEVFLKIHDTDSSTEPHPNPINLAKVSNRNGSSKISVMLDILEETRHNSDGKDKTIIFSHFSSMLSAIQKTLNGMNIRSGRYDGEVPVAKRGRILTEFESDPTIPVLLVSTKCGAVGLNLTMANRVIIMDVGCNPLLETQAIGRVHRIGQTKKVEVHRLAIRNSVEERLMEMQLRKQDMADSALDGGPRKSTDSLTSLGHTEWLYLFGKIASLPDSAPIAGPSRS